MAKLSKNYYYNSKGERKLNCYVINISKEIVKKANLEEKNLQIVVEDEKIIIKKAD